MRVYDTPTHWHWEPDMDPYKEEKLVEQFGENWKEVLEEVEYEFYNFDDEVEIFYNT